MINSNYYTSPYNDSDFINLNLSLAAKEYKTAKIAKTNLFCFIARFHLNLINSLVENVHSECQDSRKKLFDCINEIKYRFSTFDDFYKVRRKSTYILGVKNVLSYLWPNEFPIIGTYDKEGNITTKDSYSIYMLSRFDRWDTIDAISPHLKKYITTERFPIPEDFDLDIYTPNAYVYMIKNQMNQYPRTAVWNRYAPYDYTNKCFHMFRNNEEKYTPEGMELVHEKGENTKTEKYKENPNLPKEIQEKRKNTCIERFGVETPMQSDEIKNKISLIVPKEFSDNPAKLDEVKEKTKETNRERYGYDWTFQVPEFIEKRKATCIKKYGYDNPFKSEEICNQIKQYNIERYGYEYPAQSEEVQAKMIATNIERYGYTFPMCSEERRQQAIETNRIRYNVDNPIVLPEWQQKVYQTKKLHNTFNKSKIEETAYELLKSVFGIEHVDRQHKEERYPFHCDFYIDTLDMFIEIQGSWTHGTEPFDENNQEHIEKLKKWTSKMNEGKSFYESAIDVWTKRDPLKRKTAKDNKLNFVELWNMKEVNEFINEMRIKMIIN